MSYHTLTTYSGRLIMCPSAKAAAQKLFLFIILVDVMLAVIIIGFFSIFKAKYSQHHVVTKVTKLEHTSDCVAEFDYTSDLVAKFDYTSDLVAKFYYTSDPVAKFDYTSDPVAKFDYTSDPVAEFKYTSDPVAEFKYTSDPVTELEYTPDLVAHMVYFDRRSWKSHSNSTVIMVSVREVYRDVIVGCGIDGIKYYKIEVIDIPTLKFLAATSPVTHRDCYVYCFNSIIHENSSVSVFE